MRYDGKYYLAYEDRYNRVYAQGIPYWTAFPREMATTIGELERFLLHYRLEPGVSQIIEFGCGEGHLAKYLTDRGYEYFGIDISPTAISKARARICSECLHARFLVGDITDLREVESEAFDASVDNFCWQMLVTDDDRQRYLWEVSRVLRKGGKAYFFEECQEKRFEGQVRTFEEFVGRFKADYETLEDREAYVDGERRLIKLPRVPSRFNSADGYEEELTDGGFAVDKTCDVDGNCVIYCLRDR